MAQQNGGFSAPPEATRLLMLYTIALDSELTL
jgi:hypothetical protein